MRKKSITNSKRTTGSVTAIPIDLDSSIANAAISAAITPIAFINSSNFVVYINRAFLSIWGFNSCEEVIGKSASLFWEIRGIKGRISRKIQDKGGWIGELKAFRKDGSIFHAQVSTTKISGDSNGTACQMFSFIDISERVTAQNEQRRLFADLQERVKELKCLYEILSIQHSGQSTLEGILRQIAGAIPKSLRWADRAYARVVLGNLDIHTRNCIGSSSLLTIPLAIGTQAGFIEVGYYPDNTIAEKMFLLKEEEDLLFAAAKEIERLIGYKRAEEELICNRERLLQADKLSSIGVLSAEIMHEIGNPNNFISLNVKLLTQAWKNILPILESYYEQNGDFSVAGLPFTEARKELFKLLDGISEGSERIRNISSLLQTFVKMKRPLNDAVFSLNDAVRKAIEFSKNSIDASTDHFEVLLTPLDPTVKGDAGQIQQVIINLITNACQSLKSRKGLIRVSTSADHTDSSVLASVEDEGVGIDSGDIRRVMDPFFSTKRDRNCTGLGLSISNDIAISHGGKIVLSSKLNSGTTATLVLPWTMIAHEVDSDE